MVPGDGADAKLFARLVEIDAILAAKVKAAGCPRPKCEGRLDCADFKRKPRGELGEAAEAYTKRTSFCCRRDGCRQRATPPSVRFLGRKVYVAVIVVIASITGRQLATRAEKLPRQVEGVPARTVRRWLDWWSIAFALTEFWREARGLLASPVDEALLPGSLLERLGAPGCTTLTRLLRLIAPITTTSVEAEIVMAA